MWGWLHSALVSWYGQTVTPAFIFAFCDLLVSTFMSIAFGRFGLRPSFMIRANMWSKDNPGRHKGGI